MGQKIKPLRVILAGTCVIMAAALSACGSAPTLTGNWKADDGTGLKVISTDGSCKGMYYNGAKPLDIGGPMSCSLSDKKGGNGRYSLIVSQPPNQSSFEVDFGGSDSATVYKGNTKLFSMARQ